MIMSSRFVYSSSPSRGHIIVLHVGGEDVSALNFHIDMLCRTLAKAMQHWLPLPTSYIAQAGLRVRDFSVGDVG